VKSFVVLRPGATATAEEIIEHCKKQLAPYKVPKSVEFIPALPKSSMMKILRRELRDQEVKKTQARGGEAKPESQPRP